MFYDVCFFIGDTLDDITFRNHKDNMDVCNFFLVQIVR